MYKEKSGRDFNDYTSRQFIGLIVMADAINRAKSTDGEKIRAALVATDMPGETTIMPWKRVKFDEMGQNNDADPVLLQYTGGKFVTVFPAQAAGADAIRPMKEAAGLFGGPSQALRRPCERRDPYTREYRFHRGLTPF